MGRRRRPGLWLLARVTKRMLGLEVPVRQAGEIHTAPHSSPGSSNHAGGLRAAALEGMGKVGSFCALYLMVIKESRLSI